MQRTIKEILKRTYTFNRNMISRMPIQGLMGGSKILDSYTSEAATPQTALDIFKGEWASKFPDSTGLKTKPGLIPLFEDSRIDWAEKTLGGFKDKKCIELGPLEAGHSYMLQKKGASKVTAIEANSRAFLKCLCVKEVLQLDKVDFKFGDFRAHFEQSNERYDVLIASGVLYHMLDPLKLLKQMAQASDKLFIWTHYYDAKIINSNPDLSYKFKSIESFDRDGATYQAAEQFYKASLAWNGFCGGSAPNSRWLTRDSILNYLKAQGFSKIDISAEILNHQNGPSFALCAQREQVPNVRKS